MKKNVIISIITLIVVALFAFLPLKWAAAILLGSVLLSVVFGIIFMIAVLAEEKLAELEKTNPELAARLRRQMWEEQCNQLSRLC